MAASTTVAKKSANAAGPRKSVDKTSSKKRKKADKSDAEKQKKKKTKERQPEENLSEEEEEPAAEEEEGEEEQEGEKGAEEEGAGEEAEEENASLTDEQRKRNEANKRRRLNAIARASGYRDAAKAAGLVPKTQLKSSFSLASIARMVHFRQTVTDSETLPYDIDELEQRWKTSFVKCPPSAIAALQPFIEGAARSLVNAATLNAYSGGRSTVQPIHLINACRGALDVLEFSTVAPHGLVKYAQTHDKYGRSLEDPAGENDDGEPEFVSMDDMMLQADDEDKEPMEDEEFEDEEGEKLTKMEAFKEMIKTYETALAEKKAAKDAKKAGEQSAAPSAAAKKRSSASKKAGGKK